MRAHKLIKRLAVVWKEYRASGVAEYLPFPPLETDTHNAYVLRLPPMNYEDPLLIGDAVHNIRSALDLMICDIAEMRGRNRKFNFPFAQNESSLLDIIDDRLRKPGRKKSDTRHRLLGDDVVDLILNAKPWRHEQGGNRDLRGLHDLDLLDKHRIVLPVAVAGAFENPNFGLVQFNFTAVMAEGSTIQSMKGLPAPTMKGAVLEPVFPETIEAFAEEPIVTVLARLHRVALDLVLEFQNALGVVVPDAFGLNGPLSETEISTTPSAQGL